MNVLTRFVLACALSSCVAHAAIAATVYRWVDSSGQVHYGQVPPRGAAYDVIQGTPGALAPAPTAPEAGSATAGASVSPDGQRARERAFIAKADAERKAKAEAKEKERVAKEACAQARKNLSDFEQRANVPLARRTEDGKIVLLAPEDVRARLDSAKKDVDTHCS